MVSQNLHKTIKPRKHSGIVAFISMLKGLVLPPVKLVLASGGRWRKCCVCTEFSIHSQFLCFSDMLAQRKRGRAGMQKKTFREAAAVSDVTGFADLVVFSRHLFAGKWGVLCFVMRSSQTGSASSALAAQSGAAFMLLIEKVPFLLNYYFFLKLLCLAVARRLHTLVQGTKRRRK